MSLIFVTKYNVYEVTIWYLKDFLVIINIFRRNYTMGWKKSYHGRDEKLWFVLVVKVAILQVTETFLGKTKRQRKQEIVDWYPGLFYVWFQVFLNFFKIILDNFRGEIGRAKWGFQIRLVSKAFDLSTTTISLQEWEFASQL